MIVEVTIEAPVRTILLIGEIDAVRRVLGLFLERAGFAVLRARDAGEAHSIGATAEQSIDLLLADFDAPGVDLPSIVMALRARHPSLRVLFLSDCPVECLDDWPLADAALDVLTKPFMAAELIERVRYAIEAGEG